MFYMCASRCMRRNSPYLHFESTFFFFCSRRVIALIIDFLCVLAVVTKFRARYNHVWRLLVKYLINALLSRNHIAHLLRRRANIFFLLRYSRSVRCTEQTADAAVLDRVIASAHARNPFGTSAKARQEFDEGARGTRKNKKTNCI